MANIVKTLTLSFEYNSYLAKNLKSVFRIIYLNNKFFINGFNDQITTDNELTFVNNPNPSDIHIIQSNPNHYARVIVENKKNNIMIAELVFVSSLINVDDINISTEAFNNYKNHLGIDVNGNDFMFICYSDRNDKIKSFMSLDFIEKNRYLTITKEEKFNVDANYYEKFFTIKNKSKPFGRSGHTENAIYRYAIIFGKINLCTEKKASSNFNIVALEKFQSDTSNYLSLWNEYNNKEMERKFKEARELGFVKYLAFEHTKGNLYKFFFEKDEYSKIRKFPDTSFLAIGNNSVLELLNKEITQPSEYLQLELDLINTTEQHEQCMIRGTINAKFDKELSLSIVCDDGDNLLNFSNGGYIVCSLMGDMTVYKRRNQARDLIWNGQCGIPNLFSFFGDDPIPSPKQPKFEIDHSLINKQLPVNQEEALEIICNTPDIAIIQGPPGTGKTSVIEMAVTQINAKLQLADKYANNLLCAFRHETVLDLASKINIYGIPTIKLGLDHKKVNPPKIEEVITKYIDELLEKLNSKYGELSYTNSQFVEFENKYNNYVNFCSSIDESISILKYVLDLPYTSKNKDWINSINFLLKRLETANKKFDFENESFLNFLYRLPLNKNEFEDGKEEFLLDLESMNYSNTISSDSKLLFDEFKKSEIDFKKIRYIQKKLILKYRPIPNIFIENSIKKEIVDLLEKIYKSYNTSLFKESKGNEKAISDYLASLNENPLLLRNTLLEYSKAIGITNQQSYSMYLTNGKMGESETTFENVFIDEAATSSPLDLFLPMSLATRRIILVGDHKQLPNIVNEDIADELEKEKTGTIDYVNELKTTLFEHLFTKCKELEKKDGIRRVITLNTQFRMHPEIGNIVSKFFYAEEGGIESPRKENEFQHNFLNLKNQPYHWFDVPFSFDKSRIGRKQNSRFNKDEAEYIAKKIKEAINDDSYNGESIGVITLYRPQVAELNEALYRENVFTDKTFTHVVNNKQKEIKLEVGTVDAFQGKEFDIVFLSTVYSFEPTHFEEESYSRLTIKNLLCVALSRAIKSILIFGNKEIYENTRAETCVPSLCYILKKCKEKNYVS